MTIIHHSLEQKAVFPPPQNLVAGTDYKENLQTTTKSSAKSPRKEYYGYA